jgi:hypothetical protein
VNMNASRTQVKSICQRAMTLKTLVATQPSGRATSLVPSLVRRCELLNSLNKSTLLDKIATESPPDDTYNIAPLLNRYHRQFIIVGAAVKARGGEGVAASCEGHGPVRHVAPGT